MKTDEAIMKKFSLVCDKIQNQERKDLYYEEVAIIKQDA